MNLAAKRLSLPLMTVTHSVDYVRNSFDFLRVWEVRWSERTKRYIKDHCFTLETETGQRAARDWGHEKRVRLMREDASKTLRSGHQLKIENNSVTSIEQANKHGRKHAIKELAGTGPLVRERPDFTKDARSIRAYVQAFLALHDSKIMEPGLSAGEVNDSLLVSCVTGEPLDGTLLRAAQIGNDAVHHYGNRYHIETQNEVIRREKEMGLVALRSTSENIRESVDKVVKRATSIVTAEVAASGTKEEIYKEFAKLQPYLSRRQQEKVPSLTPTQLKSYSKRTLLKILIGLRKSAFPRRPEAKEALEKDARESQEGLGTSVESRRETLRLIQYSGRGCNAMNDAKFNERTCL